MDKEMAKEVKKMNDEQLPKISNNGADAMEPTVDAPGGTTNANITT